MCGFRDPGSYQDDVSAHKHQVKQTLRSGTMCRMHKRNKAKIAAHIYCILPPWLGAAGKEEEHSFIKSLLDMIELASNMNLFLIAQSLFDFLTPFSPVLPAFDTT